MQFFFHEKNILKNQLFSSFTPGDPLKLKTLAPPAMIMLAMGTAIIPYLLLYTEKWPAPRKEFEVNQYFVGFNKMNIYC